MDNLLIKKSLFFRSKHLFAILLCIFPITLNAQNIAPYDFNFHSHLALILFVFIVFVTLIIASIVLQRKVLQLNQALKNKENTKKENWNKYYLKKMNAGQITRLFKNKTYNLWLVMLLSYMHISLSAQAQTTESKISKTTLFQQPGVIITIVLLMIPIILGTIFLIIKIRRLIEQINQQKRKLHADAFANYLKSLSLEEAETLLKDQQRKQSFELHHHELSGNQDAEDTKGFLQINTQPGIPFLAIKKKAVPRPKVSPNLALLIKWYLITATVWLIFGTTVGEYLGIKFIAPDIESTSWLSFGRLRPVHTNAVFWGWSSLAMFGLSYYIIPRVSNVSIYSIKMGWYSLWLINLTVLVGSIFLMAGINNGGGEYREYIWPVMLFFGIALILTLINFLKTIAKRKNKEIYISNWYIIAAIIFTLIIVAIAYLPYWQNGLGETIVQGYYMHQGVGMWFMLFTLGIVYYFLPQQLNQPIYSYSLGILAFWTQILFYTVIGSHHFVFSAIPWWLQTIAIIGSVGMVIPVVAGTTNFLLTFKGAWYKIKDSYTLPFFLVGIIFYFTGSLQGTAEAFRTTNLIWHFTDFTVAHSHLTMYGIICFFLWAGIYAMLPRLSGKEAPQSTIGAHFWLALIGLLFYTIPLMYGSTLKGMMWIEGKPFIDGVAFMAPYWLWRAIGGSLMWISHLFFSYNIYKMLERRPLINVPELALKKLEDNNFN